MLNEYESLEIIGNIYESPELLEAGKAGKATRAFFIKKPKKQPKTLTITVSEKDFQFLRTVKIKRVDIFTEEIPQPVNWDAGLKQLPKNQ